MIWDACLILLVIVLFNFHFQRCRDPNPRLDPVGGSKLEPGLLRLFQSKHLFCLIKFSFSKVSRPESPTRPERRIRTGARFTPTFSIIFSKHLFCLIKFFVFKSVETRIPDSTRKTDPNRSPVYSDIFNYLLKTFVLPY